MYVHNYFVYEHFICFPFGPVIKALSYTFLSIFFDTYIHIHLFLFALYQGECVYMCVCKNACLSMLENELKLRSKLSNET